MLFSGDIKTVILSLLAIIICITVHEISHGFAAWKLGDVTAKSDGRLSLNPLRHIDPVGIVALLLFGFGWAKPVMIDPRNLKNPKVDMALISLAGPVSNILLAFVTILIYVPLAYYTLGHGVAVGVMTYVLTFLSLLFSYNISFGIFNLIPVPPLDGSKIFGALLPDNLYFKFTRSAHVGMVVLIILMWTDLIGKILGPLVSALGNVMINIADKIFLFLR